MVLKFTNWNPEQPDNSNQSENCVSIFNSTGKWYDSNCNETKNYICEDLNNNVEYWNSCTEGWTLINGKCYKFIDHKFKFDGAADTCKAIGGQLFEPKYEMEEKSVFDYFGNFEVWIGITDIKRENRYRNSF